MKDTKNNHEATMKTYAANIGQYPEILTRREAAAYLRMSERHFRTLVLEGRVPEINAGQRKRLYRKSALLRELEESSADEIDFKRLYGDEK